VEILDRRAVIRGCAAKVNWRAGLSDYGLDVPNRLRHDGHSTYSQITVSILLAYDAFEIAEG